MNLLSLVSFFNAMVFIAIAAYSLYSDGKSSLSRLSFLIHLGFAVWSFSLTFFYPAETVEKAWFWYKISSFGWILFAVFSLHYFLIQSNRRNFLHPWWRMACLYVPPAMLLFRSLAFPGTVVANEMVQSSSGLGWTYTASISSVWWWLFLLYLAVYLLSSVYLLGCRVKTEFGAEERRAIRRILGIDFLVMLISLSTDVMLPVFIAWIPPIANIAVLLYAIGFIREVVKRNLISRGQPISSEIILDTVMNPFTMVDELFNVAHFDTLTKLPNRRLFFMRAMEYIVQHEVDGKDFAAIFMDLNGFKRINDNFGHAVGDGLLEETAVRLKREIGQEDFLARMGGDEFVILLADVKSNVQVNGRVEGIRSQFSKGIEVAHLWCDVGIATGYSVLSYLLKSI